jgi:30S ribosomal protein S31
MGKGDKKSRRGKIILGSYGVRRPRKKTDKPVIKQVKVVEEKELKVTKPVKEKKEVKEVKDVKVAKERVEVKAEVKTETKASKAETKAPKAETKAPKAAKVKKEVIEEQPAKEPKPKKEKKS